MKKFLITGGILVAVGLVIFVILLSCINWDFANLSLYNNISTEYAVDEAYNGISIITDTADVTVRKSDDGKTSVVSFSPEKLCYSVLVENGILLIKLEDSRKWYEKLFSTGTRLDVYIPQEEYSSLSIDLSTGDTKIYGDFTFGGIYVSASTGDVECCASANGEIDITTSTGDINLENNSAGAVKLSVSTGDVELCAVNCVGDINIGVETGKTQMSDVNCKNLVTTGDTGDLIIDSVIATDKFNIKRSTGDVKFSGCDADEINVETSTGDVKGSLLTPKIIFANTDTGKVIVPQYTTGGVCKIETSTGDIIITIGE